MPVLLAEELLRTYSDRRDIGNLDHPRKLIEQAAGSQLLTRPAPEVLAAPARAGHHHDRHVRTPQQLGALLGADPQDQRRDLLPPDPGSFRAPVNLEQKCCTTPAT